MRKHICILALFATAGCNTTQSKEDMKAEYYYQHPVSFEASGQNPGSVQEGGEKKEKPDLKPEYFNGSGVFSKTVPSRHVVWSEDKGGVSLTFKNTDIRIIIQAVLGDTLGFQYLIDPRVQGNATLETSGTVDQGVLQETLETVLKINGFALVETTNGYQVLPISEAPQRIASIKQAMPGSVNLPGFGVQVVPLQYTSPTEMRQLIEPFSPPGGVLRADNVRNFMILGGTSQELTSMMRAIETFDVDWMAGMSFGIYPLKYTDPDQITEELEKILEREGMPGKGNVKYIPIPRINKLLAIAPDAETLKSIEFWIGKLDLGDSSPGRRIYVYPVKNGRAVDIADTLNLILGTSMNYGSSYGGEGRAGGRQARGNNTRNSGLSSSSRNQQSRGLGGRGSQFGLGGTDDNGIRIVPNEQNNSILMLATPTEFGVIETALRQVDLPPKQVLVEVTLVDVTLSDELRYGVQWHFEFGDNSVSLGKSASPSAEFPGFSWAHTSGSTASAVLNALEEMTDVQVISSPKLLVLNNHSATLQVGDEVPVPKASAVSTTDSNAPIVNSIEYKTTGVILTVTPRINEGGLIMLDIEQEVSNVAKTVSSGIDAPTIQQRRVTSSVATQSGSTIALGGLIRSTYSNGKSGVPFLKDIPLLGAAFRTGDKTERRSELVVLLTPRIIRDVAEQREVMDYIQQEFRSLIKPNEAALEEQLGQKQETVAEVRPVGDPK